ncbi:MAG TPA: alpha-L-arabinofuranosidase C-terminal domain-containing protein [Ferruginibacter sp.]|mgnify:CR=1 FL=1|nr:alpha-L-arabinofuranosidase C-terminal domain-containing protein [Ferruginibacter sp.]HMP20450.1 alpha-L-arabinofuranosidase C-terminal domain-containing protein [Ferruginibacter sp.]
MIKTKTSLLVTGMLIFNVVTGQNLVTLDASGSRYVIHKNIYGHFAEHLGRCIYDGIYVGEANKIIPNTEGVRNDIIAALKKLKVPNLRWPGGCFADTYHWKDGVGPKSKRPSMVNRWWGGVTEDNSFGTHDFLNLCERIGAQPYLAANVGSGTVQDFIDWIQYVNFSANSSPMSKWRVQNGREKPWNVKIWGVGNEAWGCGGNMKPEYYANIYRQYATFMTDWGNGDSLFRVASGANGDDYNWTEVLMKEIPGNMLEGVALHHYSVINWNQKGSATSFDEAQYFATMKSALKMEELVTKHSVIMDKYDPAKKVALVVDEWGGWYDVEPGTNPGFLYQQNTMRDAMIAGVTLNIFHNHCDRVKMANLAQTVNVLQAVILTNKEKMILTPTYHVLEMYNVHQDASLLPVKIISNDYIFGDAKLPAVSISASKDKAGVTHISLVNIHAALPQEVSINISGQKYASVSGKILTASRLQDFNTFEEPGKVLPVLFDDASLQGDILKVKLPPFSVVVLTLK